MALSASSELCEKLLFKRGGDRGDMTGENGGDLGLLIGWGVISCIWDGLMEEEEEEEEEVEVVGMAAAVS